MIYENVVAYCRLYKISVVQFEKKCGLTNGTVRKWKLGSDPRVNSLKKVAEATKIPIEKWVV